MLDNDYWNTRYLDENTPWDMGVVSPPLKAYFDQLEDKSLDILIPGFGQGHELLYLEKLGFNQLTGIEFSQFVLDHLSLKLNSTRLIQGDFFDLNGTYDVIIEQTFFCALMPNQRQAYVKKVHDLLKPQGKLVGVLFNRSFEGGPPFGGFLEDYRVLFEPMFKIEILEPCKNSYPGRIEAFIKFIRRD